ncbi:MAG: hypothetical protein N3B12_05985 [Armatimonadetes bacterium]|nr:hypothetical protein [Armatimonadota bacterium]
MLILYNPPVIRVTDEEIRPPAKPGRLKPCTSHTTASEILFLMESPDSLDRRIGTLA